MKPETASERHERASWHRAIERVRDVTRDRERDRGDILANRLRAMAPDAREYDPTGFCPGGLL